jgi:excisionase family DNA binding protein
MAGRLEDLVTIADAARLLKVSTVTLHRWLKQGRLPAYHVGPRAVRIRRRDLDALLTPRARKEVSGVTEAQPTSAIAMRSTVSALTDEEIRRGWEAFHASEALLEEQRARRGGVPFEESWPLIREEREERERRV